MSGGAVIEMCVNVKMKGKLKGAECNECTRKPISSTRECKEEEWGDKKARCVFSCLRIETW